MDPRIETRLSKAFCSAHFRDVPVLVRDAGPGSSGGSPDDAVDDATGATGASGASASFLDAGEAITCLDYGVRCTGWLCPMFSVPTLPAEDLLAEAVEAERMRATRMARAAAAPPVDPVPPAPGADLDPPAATDP